MLACAALAQFALAEIPFFGIPLPPPRVNAQGIIVVVDVVPNLTYGTKPSVGKAFALLINQPFIYTGTPLENLSLIFQSPSGKTQFSDNRYVRTGERNILELEQFSTPQWLLYQAATGEFTEPGVWQVNVQSAQALSAPFFFTVTNA